MDSGRLKDMYGSTHRGENSKKQQQKHEHKRRRYSDRKFVLIILITSRRERGQARYGQEDAAKQGERNRGWLILTNKPPRARMAYEVLSG